MPEVSVLVFAGKFGWLHSQPSASAKDTRYPPGLENLRTAAFEASSLSAEMPGGSAVRLATLARVAGESGWLRSRPAASAKHVYQAPIGSKDHPHFGLCSGRALPCYEAELCKVCSLGPAAPSFPHHYIYFAFSHHFFKWMNE